ncbi:MAG: DUF349 domain-containing protein [Bacteroidales bacterium]|nr:DUF349 domain-containing protein [Bacteroidales bacterium]
MNENELSPVKNQEPTASPIQDGAEQNVNESQVTVTEPVAAEEYAAEEEKAAEEAQIAENEQFVNEIELIDCTALSREELIEKLSELLQNDDIEAIKANVAAIKVAFHEKTREERKETAIDETSEPSEDEEKAAAVPEDADPLEKKFNEVFNIYRQKRAKYLEQLEEQKKVNLVEKQQILEQMKELVNSDETLKTTYDQFRTLQEKWKSIGIVPKNEANNLWQNYHFLVEKFFDKVRINRELRDLDYQKNLEAKIALCEKTEELLIEKSTKKAFTKLQEYREEWKQIGPVPSDKRDELWERFKTAADKINAQRKEQYQAIKEQQDNNYAAKLALVEQSEKLLETTPTSLAEWQSVSDQLNEIFKMWKTIGPAAKVQNDEIWNKFKPMLDSFFAQKKEYFDQLKSQLQNNYNMKLDLCTQAEAVKDSDDWAAATQTLINLQKEWKTIGPTPKKQSEKIWKRFRAACDEFFERKEKFYSSINEVNEENLKKKQALIEEIKNFTIDESNVQESLSELKKLQRQWMEIGHVPKKDKDAIQQEYRNAINEKFDKLKSIGADIANYNFRTKIEQYKENPNGSQLINKERNSLINRIQTMKEDVALWENNIGFLSNSKNSTILKDEFEKKIEKTKQEIALLEAKVKYLDEGGNQ